MGAHTGPHQPSRPVGAQSGNRNKVTMPTWANIVDTSSIGDPLARGEQFNLGAEAQHAQEGSGRQQINAHTGEYPTPPASSDPLARGEQFNLGPKPQHAQEGGAEAHMAQDRSTQG